LDEYAGYEQVAKRIANFRFDKMLRMEGCDCGMKNHRFWAWAMIVCLVMTVYTGYKHD
jgi:hypothetical protein